MTEDGVELQGELRDRVRAHLEKKGFVVKGRVTDGAESADAGVRWLR